MKKKFNVKMLLAVILCLALVGLTACGAKGNKDSEKGGKQGNVTNYDMDSELKKVEADVAALEKTLKEDASLTQADMNQLSNEIYKLWDGLLNDMWKVMDESLDEDTMETLSQDQKDWIAERDQEVRKAGEAFAGGSIAALIMNEKAAELTKARVYELAPYLTK